MAPKYSSSSAAGAMRASLVLVLLLTAVAAAQADRTVSCENKSGAPMKVNGIVVAVNAVVSIPVVQAKLKVAFKDKYGKDYEETCDCPEGVSAVVILYVNGYLKLKVKAVLLGILNLLFKILGSYKCDL